MTKEQVPSSVRNLLSKLDITHPVLLGKGGEGYIFSLNDSQVIKIYENTNLEYLQSLGKFQNYLISQQLPFATPAIQDIGKSDNTFYTVEKRLQGIPMEEKFPTLSEKDKYIMLTNYYNALKQINAIELSDSSYGNILKSDETLIDTTWQSFLSRKLQQRIALSETRLKRDVRDFDRKVSAFQEIIHTKLSTNDKYLVHGDYYINNVLVNDNCEISAVLDFSVHAVVGDRKLDIASISFFAGTDYLPEHIAYLKKLARQDYGDDIEKYIEIYALYYNFYFADIYKMQPQYYQEQVVENLNDRDLWKRISL